LIHFNRYIASLLLALSLLGAYALAVAPLLEPPPIVRREAAPQAPVLPAATTRADLERLFQPPAWELDSPKVLETEHFTLLVKDYQPTPDGRLELTPCTLIFYMAGSKTPDGKPEPRRPIVLQAPQGAMLQFDRPLNIAKAEFGRVLGGRLEGDIKIFSPATAPGAGDDLELQTRNVQLDKDRVFTPHEVQFRYGESFGSGRSLQIALMPKDPEDPSGKSGIGGVQSLTLESIDRLRLATGGSGLGAGLLPGTAQSKGKENTPLEVTCTGPFVFDVLQNVAMFDERVLVERIHANAPADTLRCDRLLLHLGEPEDGTGPLVADTSAAVPVEKDRIKDNPARSDDPPVRLQRIVAIGRPAELSAPSSATAASAARIEYVAAERKLALVPSQEVPKVSLRQEGNDFQAKQLDYEIASPGRLGKLWAAGPGQVKLVQGSGAEQQTVVARWEKSLHLAPDPQAGEMPGHVLSLVEKASVDVLPLGQFAANELHVWLLEVPQLGNNLSREPGRGDKTQARTRTSIVPSRLLATGEVRCDAPQIHAETGRLEAWFVNQPPAEPKARPMPGQAAVIGPPRESRPIEPPPMQKFDVRGKLVQMQVILRGSQPDLEDLTIRGEAVISESRTPEPGQVPLRIAGDALELRGAATGAGKIDVIGHPAEVSGRGMSLASGTIHLLRSENRLWIDGPGEAKFPLPATAAMAMTLPTSSAPIVREPHPRAPQGLEGPAAASAAQPVHLVWQDSLTFDGRVAMVEGEVNVRTATQLVTSPSLEVTLAQRFDFVKPERREAVELRSLKFDGGVFLENRGTDERGEQISLDRGQVQNLVFDRARGTLHADGPGWVSSTRQGTATLPAGPGAVPMPQPLPAGQSPPLTYIHVAFVGSIEGDLAKREIQFLKQVRTTYAPVGDWEERVVAEKLADLGERGVLLTSDRLSVVEMLLPGARWIETSATGNTVVEGQTFTVRAPKISYASDKQVLTLEGDGRAEAELWYQNVPGQPNSYAAAQKWRYWLDSGLFDVEGAKVFDLQQLGTGSFRLPGMRR
jgi:hypothetical protein